MRDLSQNILSKIKKKNIKPSPRWKFLLKNYAWWFAGGLSVIAGGVGSSVIYYMLVNNDWDIYQYVDTSLVAFILVSAPYFWLVFFIIFIFLADYYLKHTKYGYRLSLIKVISWTMLASIILGFIFYNIGVAQFIDKELSQTVPIYNDLTHNRAKFWMQPEKGLLLGIILEIENNDNFVIRDLSNKIWQIKGDNLLVLGPVDFSVGAQIRLIGNISGDNEFSAKNLRPAMGRRHHLMENKPMRPPHR